MDMTINMRWMGGGGKLSHHGDGGGLFFESNKYVLITLVKSFFHSISIVKIMSVYVSRVQGTKWNH
jgi:hypothetical protein